MPTALITGSTRGIGRATAAVLAHRGYDIIVTGRDAADAKAGADNLSTTAPGSIGLGLDVTDRQSVREAAATVEQRFGSLDVLVNNAGVLPEATADLAGMIDYEMFRRTYDTNVFGVVNVLEAFLPLLTSAPAGRIVNVSTTMGSLSDQTDPDSPYYAMMVPAYQSSKAALNNITIALAKQLADSPITVTSVCPGFVQTDLTPVNREQAPLTAQQAADVVVRAATLGPDAASGTFIDADGAVDW